MKRFEKAVTSVSATDMTSAVLRFAVTASAEQIPRICNAIGLLSKTGAKSTASARGFAEVLVFTIQIPLVADVSEAGRSPVDRARSESCC
jgi:hypothetical protein